MKIAIKMAAVVMLGLAGLAGCGEVRNPFVKEKPFVPTKYPADFAIVLDEAQDTYYARQNIHQVIMAGDAMSRTTWTTLRDYNNSVASQFTTEHPVSQSQLQNMWNEVQRYNLMQGAEVWYYWKTNPDNYRRDEHTMQIRANGKTVAYKQLNHWGYKFRDLALQVQAVRFPVALGGGVNLPTTQPAGAAATEPATAPATGAVTPATEPATQAASQPATAPEKEEMTKPVGPEIKQ